MDNHPIKALMETAMQSIKDMVDVNTVVGDAVETQDGTVIVPISRVSVGFVAGGGDYASDGEGGSHPFAGGSGAGVTVQPMGFLVVTANNVRLLPVTEGALYDRLIDLAPELIDRLMGWAGVDGRTFDHNGDPLGRQREPAAPSEEIGGPMEPIESDSSGANWRRPIN